MSDLRKDAFVAVQTAAEVVLGVIAKMDKKANTITLKLPDGGETEVAYDIDAITKVTKVEFNQLLSGTTLNDLFQARAATPAEEDVVSSLLQEAGAEAVVTKPAKAPKAKAAKVVDETAEAKEPAKADKARALFVEMTAVDGTARKDVIKAFIETLGLTKQGAATYYYNCTKARKAGDL